MHLEEIVPHLRELVSLTVVAGTQSQLPAGGYVQMLQ